MYEITRYRHTNQNLSTKLRRILRKAGITPWPKPYQNLHGTKQTKLAEEWPMQELSVWLGNSPAVAL